jgi:hypothetical protein
MPATRRERLEAICARLQELLDSGEVDRIHQQRGPYSANPDAPHPVRLPVRTHIEVVLGWVRQLKRSKERDGNEPYWRDWAESTAQSIERLWAWLALDDRQVPH